MSTFYQRTPTCISDTITEETPTFLQQNVIYASFELVGIGAEIPTTGSVIVNDAVQNLIPGVKYVFPFIENNIYNIGAIILGANTQLVYQLIK
jgi:hypothetical protein